MLEGYLERLAGEAGRRLSPDEADAFVAEAREHLEHSIQARLELGASPEEAEREAVAAFGNAEAVGKELEPREPMIDRRFLFVSLALVAYAAFFGGGRSFPDWAALPVVGAAVVLHGAYWWTSARLRRPQWIALVVVLVPLWLAISVPQGLDEAAFVRDNLSGALAQNRKLRTLNAHKEAALSGGFAAFARRHDVRSPSRVPVFEADGDLRLFVRADHAAATAMWAKALENGAHNLRWEREWLAEREARQARLATTPTWSFILRAVGEFAATHGWGPATFYIVTHLYAWLFGALLRRRRARHGPTVA